ncbi:hypothetical protein PR048_011666 [Dryococelus australis]|uniref:Uncharacterized protein n=1 Tax=Dryococelus australis TaxID=614101 RepID=A0ABQ9HM90_9NEOP|nr:hypothetical protein PR048_011666 [Dryococelus australis]
MKQSSTSPLLPRPSATEVPYVYSPESLPEKHVTSTKRGRGGRAFSSLASHQGDPGSIPNRVTTDPRMGESCRTMPLVGGFSRGSPVSLPLHSGAAPYSPQSPSSALNISLSFWDWGNSSLATSLGQGRRKDLTRSRSEYVIRATPIRTPSVPSLLCARRAITRDYLQLPVTTCDDRRLPVTICDYLLLPANTCDNPEQPLSITQHGSDTRNTKCTAVGQVLAYFDWKTVRVANRMSEAKRCSVRGQNEVTISPWKCWHLRSTYGVVLGIQPGMELWPRER